MALGTLRPEFLSTFDAFALGETPPARVRRLLLIDV